MIETNRKISNAVISSASSDLSDIHLTSKNIGIYERQIEALSNELRLIKDRQIELRASGSVAEIMAQLKNTSGILSHCTLLKEDISALLKLFSAITGAEDFRLLFCTITSNMCRRFHTDINDLRLLCTYIGPGTLWLPNEAVNQAVLQSSDNEAELVLPGWEAQQVKTGDVVILKGALFEDSNPILHRSPPIEESHDKRLLLRIDTNTFINSLS